MLLTQLAIELEDTQQGKALAYAQEALGLSPSLVPAAAVAGRILASQGNTARATKLLTQAWRTLAASRNRADLRARPHGRLAARPAGEGENARGVRAGEP